MSDEILTVPALSDGEQAILNRLVKQLSDKRRRNLLRSSYYDGRHAVRSVGGVIPPRYENLAMVLGWAAKGVDELDFRCNIDGFTWADGNIDSLGIDELEDSNFLASELSQARTDSMIHGISYLITTKGSEGEPRALVHAKDALNATGEWNDRTRRLDNLLSVTARQDDQITGFVLYLHNETISAEKERGVWRVERSPHGWGVPAEPMVFRPRVSRRLGRSRISRPVMSIQDSALRALVRLEAHMDIYAIPQMVLLGADESIFKNPDGSVKASWQIVMGRVFGIPDNLDADQANQRAQIERMAAESPEPNIKHINLQAKLMAREYSLADSDFAITDYSNPTSPEAYENGSRSLAATAERATDDWGIPIRRTVQRALAIQNGLESVPEEWRSIKIDWRDPKYTSRSQMADAGAKQIGAVPELARTKVGLKLLGLSQEDIDQAEVEMRRNAGRAVVAAVTGQDRAVAG